MRAASFDSLAILGIPITGRPTTDQTLKYNGTTWTFADLASGGSGDVGGGSNLTTANRMVGVDSAGTVTEYSDFIRTAAGRFQIYDATGPTTLTVRAGSAQSSTKLLSLQRNTSSTLGEHYAYEVGGGVIADIWSSDNSNGISAWSGGLQLSSNSQLYFHSGTITALSSSVVSAAIKLSSANNLAITNGSSTTYWTLGAAGIQCGSGDGNSAACDVGTTGARVRNVNAAGYGVFGGNVQSSGNVIAGNQVQFSGGNVIAHAPATGILTLYNAAANDFGRLQFGGTTSSFPALKRSTTILQCRLADDSAYAPFVSSNLQRGSGAPESAVTGVVGDLFQRTDGGAATSLYLKESGSSNTGWSALASVQKNGVYLQVGATNYLMPGLFPVTLPTTSGMSWLANQGTATASTSSTGGALKLNFTTGTSGWRIYGKSISGFTKVTVAIGCPGFADGTSSRADLEFCGFGLRDSSTGRLQLWHTQNFSGTTYFGVSNFTDATTYSGHERINYLNMSLALLYLQVEKSGSTAIYRISSDGFNWETVLSTSSFLGTPDEVFVAGQAGSTGDIPMFVYSWKEE